MDQSGEIDKNVAKDLIKSWKTMDQSVEIGKHLAKQVIEFWKKVQDWERSRHHELQQMKEPDVSRQSEFTEFEFVQGPCMSTPDEKIPNPDARLGVGFQYSEKCFKTPRLVQILILEMARDLDAKARDHIKSANATAYVSWLTVATKASFDFQVTVEIFKK